MNFFLKKAGYVHSIKSAFVKASILLVEKRKFKDFFSQFSSLSNKYNVLSIFLRLIKGHHFY